MAQLGKQMTRCLFLLVGFFISVSSWSDDALSYPIKTVTYGDYTYTLYPEKYQGSKLVIEHGAESKTLSLDFYSEIGGWQHDAYPYDIDIAVNRNGFVLIYTGYYNDDGAFLLNQYDFDGVIKKENIWVGSEAYGGHRGAVKTLNDGNFLVIWQTNAPNGYPELVEDANRESYLGYIVGRLVSADCNQLGQTFIINAGSGYLSDMPTVTQDESGQVYVTWSEYEESVVGGLSGSKAFTTKPIDQVLSGSEKRDTIYGYDGQDGISGENGDDIVDGGTGDDVVAGDNGNDQLVGGDGSDGLEGGPGNDQIDGDGSLDGTSKQQSMMVAERAAKSKDTVRFTGRFSEYAVRYNSKTKAFTVQDKVKNRDGKDVIRNVEVFRFKDVKKTVESLVKSPTTVQFSASRDEGSIVGNSAELKQELSIRSAEVVKSSASVNSLNLTKKNIILLGSGNLKATGNSLNNIIYGNSGNNLLGGGPGSDAIIGGPGKDVIDVGIDRDADVVAVLSASDAATGKGGDTVRNFNLMDDVVDLSRMDANEAIPGKQHFSFRGYIPTKNAIWLVKYGSTIVVQGDVNGDLIADFKITLENVGKLTVQQIRL